MRKLVVSIFITILAVLLFIPTVKAHELFIQVEEFENSGELRVDVLWGHIRDYVDEATIDDFELYVKKPNGEVNTLPLEQIGVHSRAYVPTEEDGSYIFWATREKGTYTPQDGATLLSNQQAKTVYHMGNTASNANEAVDMELEIIPNTDIAGFSTGEFSGTVTLRGDTVPDTTLTAYGPEHEVLETTTDENGDFQFTFESNGAWLIKANVMEQGPGSLNGEAYEEISNATTLLIDTSEVESENEANQQNLWTYIAIAVTGLLIGAGISLFIVKRD